jgi:hypothetical protein
VSATKPLVAHAKAQVAEFAKVADRVTAAMQALFDHLENEGGMRPTLNSAKPLVGAQWGYPAKPATPSDQGKASDQGLCPSPHIWQNLCPQKSA